MNRPAYATVWVGSNAELCGGTSATNAQLCVTKEQ